jgi:hypothetical protein
MHMFEVESHDAKTNSFKFSGGGQQGGRNWCRCDQCGYAGKWCEQHSVPANNSDTRLIGGDWFIENAFELLDAEGEFYFNKSTKTLYFKPNGTAVEQFAPAATDKFAAPAGPFTVPVLETLISLKGSSAAPVKNVRIQGIGFRDAAATFMGEWGAPVQTRDYNYY